MQLRSTAAHQPGTCEPGSDKANSTTLYPLETVIALQKFLEQGIPRQTAETDANSSGSEEYSDVFSDHPSWQLRESLNGVMTIMSRMHFQSARQTLRQLRSLIRWPHRRQKHDRSVQSGV